MEAGNRLFIKNKGGLLVISETASPSRVPSPVHVLTAPVLGATARAPGAPTPSNVGQPWPVFKVQASGSTES